MVPIVLGRISSSAAHFFGKLTGLLIEAGAKAEADERHNRETAEENFMVDNVREAVKAIKITADVISCPANTSSLDPSYVCQSKTFTMLLFASHPAHTHQPAGCCT
jgi:hypothetical protein